MPQGPKTSELWQVEIHPAAGQADRLAQALAADVRDLGAGEALAVTGARGFLIEGNVSSEQVHAIARQLLSDAVAERFTVRRVGQNGDVGAGGPAALVVHVLPKPGVTDPEADTALRTMQRLGIPVEAVRTFRQFSFPGLPRGGLSPLVKKLLANDSVEQTVEGPLALDHLQLGQPYQFALITVPLRDLDDEQLDQLSRSHFLNLSTAEMRAIQEHFRGAGREPTDIELETIAQTWSEHCSHKTLKSQVTYEDERGVRTFASLLKDTVFAATDEIRRRAGSDDWCVSVFRDNAGIVRFDEDHNVTFKVETHNRPSAIEPYGGASTGVGGVIRDTLGTGLGARPICSTDVFCFAPPELTLEEVPPGALHPRRVMRGVVSGVRDYGNRMGIPTVNGAIYFDRRYIGNPLVFCGNVGLIPHKLSFKQPRAGDWIVTIGGRTGRDGIHGATFSSAELTESSERVSGGAVQIGNAITEKMMMDVVLEARDRGLFTAITDCGAGGFSSAVGEMAAEIGAEVWLDRAPLKYAGLTYTEVWISEAQERMILAVPPDHWPALAELCSSENVEATIIGHFVDSGQLVLKYNDVVVGQLPMSFLHHGLPQVVRRATYRPTPARPPTQIPDNVDWTSQLLAILSSLNVASKHWVIRQYDHEVQAGSVIKPLVGAREDGPSDAAVVRPVLGSPRAIAVSCGCNPLYADWDTYHMAASAIDEAVRNCVAVGANPRRIALLDNFCWGSTDRPEMLGALVRAALACRDVAIELGTPFISGKDSLHNQFTYRDAQGARQTISIPHTLLISALGQLDDATRAVTMDFKRPGHAIFLVGLTDDHLGGSHFDLVSGLGGGPVPTVDASAARRTFAAVHGAIAAGMVRACHDLSEGGLAAALAEMSIAGLWGAQVELDRLPGAAALVGGQRGIAARLFSESSTRFLMEVPPDKEAQLRETLAGLPIERIGQVTDAPQLVIIDRGREIVRADVELLRERWRTPLDWN
jgi:phosphoribosylformylglycinamidine synthase